MSEDIKNGIQLCPDGKYRWAYEVNMYRNPTIFYVIANMFLICYLVCVVLFSVINFCLDEEVLSSILMLTHSSLSGDCSHHGRHLCRPVCDGRERH